ncbi:MAG: MBL fold metallo-hydrolase [Myxococcales bacterium]|nr:MBL fold metallo-hydrolase [Myxococcales bacterium]
MGATNSSENPEKSGVQRKIWALDGNSQKLDGGAMFGNAPRAVWSRWMTPDDRGRIDLACRALLIEETGGTAPGGTDVVRRILLETGVGAFFPPKLRDRFGVQEPEHVLLRELDALGLGESDIDVVVLSHLHFDHAGGLLTVYEEGQPLQLAFSTAQFVVSEGAWQRALSPHMRDRASYIKELQPLLEQSGRLEVVGGGASEVLGSDYRLHYSDGHTPGLMLVEVPSEDGPVIFAGDLIPGMPWVHLPITMGYDRYPELLIDEKTALLTDLVSRGGRLFFTHDPDVAVATVAVDERGRYRGVDGLSKPRGLLL